MNTRDPASADNFLPSCSEHAAARVDWAATPLGPVSRWSPELRAAADLCLGSQFEMALAWGPQFVYLYNDVAGRFFGSKHPWALGRRVEEVWPEAWPTVGPLLDSVYRTGKAVRFDDLRLMVDPDGVLVESYLTFSYSPVHDAQGAVAGVLVVFKETSDRVLAERRQRTVVGLATAVARGGAVLEAVRGALSANANDLPWTAIYAEDAAGEPALLQATCIDPAGVGPRARAELARLARATMAGGQPQLLDTADLDGLESLCSPWPEPPRQVLALPFRRGGSDLPAGVLLAGVNPRRPLDSAYRAFFDDVVGHVAHAVALAEADAAERRRSAAMAELERSRNQFFANASHELRTPLTMVLGPLGSLLEHGASGLAPDVREQVEMAHRNALRLHKLVDALMDIARIEAGTLPLHPEAVDPIEATTGILALFRAPVEEAGLRLSLAYTLAPGELVFDREMWEKIVFHLLSNAFKFTLAGEISVALAKVADKGGEWLELAVSDTGIGIAASELPRVFDRFYRGADADGRSSEGSGVGLAVVRELARLHGGEAVAESAPGSGSRFVVRVPWRRAPPGLPAPARDDRQQAMQGRRARFGEELRRYTLRADESVGIARGDTGQVGSTRVLVVERDQDVVRYIARLLRGSCAVAAASSADEAMAALAARRPDLVLVDAMLPGVDGLALVRRIRADGLTRALPVLLLSARAGEEARVEALGAGADDYLAKPFSGRELIARVRAHVQMARLRRAAIEQEGLLRRQIAELRNDLSTVLDGTRDTVVSLDRELRIVALNDAAAAAAGLSKERAVGAQVMSLAPDLPGGALEQALQDAVAARDTAAVEYYHRQSHRWFEVRCYPAPHGVLLFGTDITSRKLSEQALRQAHADLECRVEERTEALRAANSLLAAVFDRAPGGIALSDWHGRVVKANAAYAALVGVRQDLLPGRSLEEWIEASDMTRLREGQARLLAGALDSYEIEVRYRCGDGRRLWAAHFVSLIGQSWEGERCFVTIARDITARKRDEAERETARSELRTLYERLQSVRENERKALAREVHDQLGQILSAAKIDIKLLEDDLRDGERPVRRDAMVAELGSASATLDRAIGLVREIATELRAPELDAQGLYAAIAWHVRDFEQRTRIACHLTFEPTRPHPSRPAAAALLGILHEAMTNVLRHAKASKVWVSLERRGAGLVLRVRDDGIGIARRHLRDHAALGLQGMRERAELVDGKLLAGPLSPRGTLVSARVPLKLRKGGPA